MGGPYNNPSPQGVPLARVFVSAALLVAAALLTSCDSKERHRSQSTSANFPSAKHISVTAPPSPVANVVASLDPTEARAANAALPFALVKLEFARPLIDTGLGGSSAADDSSLKCLTAAIYYEAGSETLLGKRAVAQVVLNRVRHPSFPNSICGVVYEGSERPTGCQFTFTCDGSLNRTPYPRAWERARAIARQALTGEVEPSVGMATHYHTDWVFPYWAPGLKKLAKVGTHIFYTWPGAWGRRSAFTQQAVWTALAPEVKQIPDQSPIPPPEQTETISAPPPILADHTAGALKPPPSMQQSAAARLKADEVQGSLIAGEKSGRGS